MKSNLAAFAAALSVLPATPAFADAVSDAWVGKRVVFKQLSDRDYGGTEPDHYGGDKVGSPDDEISYRMLYGNKAKVMRIVRVNGKASHVVLMMENWASPADSVVSVRIQANGNAPGLGLYVPPSKLPVTMVLGAELGGVKIGAPPPSTAHASATARFGRPKIETGTVREGTFFWGPDPDYPSFGYRTMGGRVASLTTSDPVFKTAEGIGVGTRLSKVKAVYPGGRTTGPAFATPPTYIVKRGGHTTTFTLENDQVSAIDIN